MNKPNLLLLQSNYEGFTLEFEFSNKKEKNGFFSPFPNILVGFVSFIKSLFHSSHMQKAFQQVYICHNNLKPTVQNKTKVKVLIQLLVNNY